MTSNSPSVVAPLPALGGKHSRPPPQSPRPSPHVLFHGPPRRIQDPSPSRLQRPTPAEAYAEATQPRRDKDDVLHPHAQHSHHTGGVKTKPLFDWFSRKLGAGRRATYSNGTGPIPVPRGEASRASRNGGHARTVTSPTVSGRDARGAHHGPLSPAQIFGPATSTRENSIHMSRSESHSLRSYSMSYANSVERDRRREANNPYPSMPVPAFQYHRGSTVDTVSESFLSRSRTPSLRSEGSRPVISLMDGDDASLRDTNEADEDASIRPFPPSHPSSPNPSQSLLSRSASASLLSPIAHGVPRPSSYVARPKTQRSLSSSTDSSDRCGRQSRQGSTSTKPTTVLSFDSDNMAHIAQAPPQAPHPVPGTIIAQHMQSAAGSPLRLNLNDQAENDGLRELHPTPTSPSAPFPLGTDTASERASLTRGQAPKHTHPHPMDNPHPSSPPQDNASTLTLASSTFAETPTTTPLSGGPPHLPLATTRLRDFAMAPPHLNATPVRPPSLATSPSVTFATEANPERPVSACENTPSVQSLYALSAYGPSIGGMSVRTGGWRGGSAADGDASVRAIRRKGSWESNESGWSWKGQLYATGQGAILPQAGPPSANRLSAYNPDEEGLAHYTNARDSYMTARSRLSKGSKGSRRRSSEHGHEETPVLEDRPFDVDRVATPITA